MKLHFDENLSRKLVVRLAELYPASAHVAAFDLLEHPDRDIWDFARANGFTIVTTDADFYELAAALGPPPKVVWLRRWTHPTRDAEFVLRRDAERITEFGADPTLGLLVLDRHWASVDLLQAANRHFSWNAARSDRSGIRSGLRALARIITAKPVRPLAWE